MSSEGKTGTREILIFLAGLVIAGVAVFMVLRGGDEPAPSPSDQETAAQTDESEQTAAPETSDEPAPSQEATEAAPEPAPVVPVENEPDEPAPTSDGGLTPDAELVAVPSDEGDPRAVAAAYIAGSRSIDYRVAPGSWLEEADYLTPEFAAQLQDSQDVTADEWDQDFIDRQFIMGVEEVQVKLDETDDVAGALVLVQWKSYVMEKDKTDSRGAEQAVWVIVEDVDGQWLVSGEGHSH
ncbi:hypothetical protein [Ornithinimicrobium murale]|uniref:hypothetical protein n=1 Tax=Ornithinimicrobium murale TaxID=1050153 RepID=UPI000E0D74D2|nr:hypothetical protein [Ornithinimicrobium murale]